MLERSESDCVKLLQAVRFFSGIESKDISIMTSMLSKKMNVSKSIRPRYASDRLVCAYCKARFAEKIELVPHVGRKH